MTLQEVYKQNEKEKQSYLDKCAIAAMRSIISLGRSSTSNTIIADISYSIASAMLAERERRAKG